MKLKLYNNPILKPLLNRISGAMLAMLMAGICSASVAQTPPSSEQPPEQDEPAQTAYPPDSAHAWLSKMAQAINTLNYQISFVVLKPGMNAQPYLWRHGMNDDGDEFEQLNLLNGPGREVLRINDQVSYFEPNVPPYSLRSSVINGPLPIAFFHAPLVLSDSYDFFMVGRSRVSGRAAQQLRIVSKDKSRFGFNLWLDQETGMLLKMNTVDLQGQLLEQIQVTELTLSQSLHPYFARIERENLPDIIDFSPQQTAPRWDIEYMPNGMKAVRWDIHRLPITGQAVEYMMLSDGLVDVSVYIQPAGQSQDDNNLLLRYESDTFLSVQQGPAQVTIVGKLPAQTASAIASSIRPSQ